jgi:hypothetical protein
VSIGGAGFVFHHLLHNRRGDLGTYALPFPAWFVRAGRLIVGAEPMQILTQHRSHHLWPDVRVGDLPEFAPTFSLPPGPVEPTTRAAAALRDAACAAMSTTYRVLMFGASYGSLLAASCSRGHTVHLVCLAAEAALINREGFLGATAAPWRKRRCRDRFAALARQAVRRRCAVSRSAWFRSRQACDAGAAVRIIWRASCLTQSLDHEFRVCRS